MIMLFLFLFSSTSWSYGELFNAQSSSEVSLYMSKRVKHKLLREKCGLAKQQKTLMWPCYLLPDTKITTEVMEKDCLYKLDKVLSLSQLPGSEFVERLPALCKKLILKRREVLAYKGNGI